MLAVIAAVPDGRPQLYAFLGVFVASGFVLFIARGGFAREPAPRLTGRRDESDCADRSGARAAATESGRRPTRC